MGVWREDCGDSEEAGSVGAEGQGTAAGVQPLAGGCPSGGPVGAAWRLDREVAGVVSSEHCDACLSRGGNKWLRFAALQA